MEEDLPVFVQINTLEDVKRWMAPVNCDITDSYDLEDFQGSYFEINIDDDIYEEAKLAGAVTLQDVYNEEGTVIYIFGNPSSLSLEDAESYANEMADYDWYGLEISDDDDWDEDDEYDDDPLDESEKASKYKVGDKVRWWDEPSRKCAPGYGTVKEVVHDSGYTFYTIEWDDGQISEEVTDSYLKPYRKPTPVYRDEYYQNQWRRTTESRKGSSKKLSENYDDYEMACYQMQGIVKHLLSRYDANTILMSFDDTAKKLLR